MERLLPHDPYFVTCGKSSYKVIPRQDNQNAADRKLYRNMFGKDRFEVVSVNMLKDNTHKEEGHILTYIIDLQKEHGILLPRQGEIFVKRGESNRTRE